MEKRVQLLLPCPSPHHLLSPINHLVDCYLRCWVHCTLKVLFLVYLRHDLQGLLRGQNQRCNFGGDLFSIF